jgi:hypothetical protein
VPVPRGQGSRAKASGWTRRMGVAKETRTTWRVHRPCAATHACDRTHPQTKKASGWRGAREWRATEDDLAGASPVCRNACVRSDSPPDQAHTNERTVELDGPFSSTVAAYPPRCLPAVTRRKDVGDAGQHGDRGQHPQSLKPDQGPHMAHHQKSQRMPAPSVRAMDATSARTQVKRTRLVFTSDSVRRSFTLEPATGRSSRWKDPWLCVPASRRVCPGR